MNEDFQCLSNWLCCVVYVRHNINCLPVQLQCHPGNVRHHVLDFRHERLNMTHQDRVVYVIERLLGRKRHVEDGEQRYEPWINVIPTTARLSHRRHPAEVSKPFPVEVFAAVIAASALQQHLQQSYWLLRTVLIHLRRQQRQ